MQQNLQDCLLTHENERLEEQARDLESLAQDMQDLKELMTVLSGNVAEQGEAVEAIDHHVENAAVNVSRGELLLAQVRLLECTHILARRRVFSHRFCQVPSSEILIALLQESSCESSAIRKTVYSPSSLQARHLKTAALPILGLTVGFAAGGPIGAVAGARIGFATSMIGGAIGYAGGKVLHKFNNLTSFGPRLPMIEAPPESREAEKVQR